MMVHVENTPNPLSLKFLPEEGRVVDNPIHFSDIAHASCSPLAVDLFKIEGVRQVFLGGDFISVTIDDENEWSYIKPQVIACISDYYCNHLAIINPNVGEESNHQSYDEDSIEFKIITLLEERIRPSVSMDGGDVVFCKFEDGKVYIKLQGACSGCPSSSATLKHGIENMIKYFIPEVEEVVEL